MYCRAGQSTEEEMYNNEESGPALDEFLEMLGQRVRLKGFDKYKAGLDNKSESMRQDCDAFRTYLSVFVHNFVHNFAAIVVPRHLFYGIL